MSLYGDYLKERTNDHIIETEVFFATYRFLNEKQCYIIDIYVQPGWRGEHVATEAANRIAHIAKERGCTELLGTVVPSAKNSTASVQVLINYGMTLLSASNDLIIFKKELL